MRLNHSIIVGIVAVLSMMVASLAWADNPGLIVTADGKTIEAYDIDCTPSQYVYYSMEAEGAIMKMPKSDVLVVKLQDGTRYYPEVAISQSGNDESSRQLKDESLRQRQLSIAHKCRNPYANRPEVTHRGVRDAVDPKVINVYGDDKQELTMRVVSENERTLSVTKPRKKLKYTERDYIVPEFVRVDSVIYSVIDIADEAFKYNGFTVVAFKSVLLPKTLRRIGTLSFYNQFRLGEIIIPDNVKYIGYGAYCNCGMRNFYFKEIYIPEGVTYIGDEAFRCVGKKTSPMGYYQGRLSGIPPFINERNCTDYGIDDNAVEDYYRRIEIEE